MLCPVYSHRHLDHIHKSTPQVYHDLCHKFSGYNLKYYEKKTLSKERGEETDGGTVMESGKEDGK